MRKKIIKWFLYGLGGIVVILLLIFGTTEFTSRPKFCSNCHYMQPYVEGWKTSSHDMVTCTDCHFAPGFKSKIRGKFTALSMLVNYMTGIYKRSKPWAEITDESCLRSGCHTERLLHGKVLFKEGIVFDHKPHLTELRRGKKLRCTSCHSQIVQGEHITVTESTCFLCHFMNEPDEAPINDCTWCHSAPIASMEIFKAAYDHTFVLAQNIDCRKCHGKMQVGDGTVPKERCSSCHAEVGKIEKYNDSEFIHKNHVTDHKVECQNCHLAIQHKSVSRTRAIFPDCQSCHRNSHQAQYYLFSGTGGLQVPTNPNPMFEGGLNCQSCHVSHQYEGIEKNFGDTMEANPQSCESCHGKGYTKILNQWKGLMKEKITVLDEALTKVKKQVENTVMDDSTKKKVQELLDEAIYNFDLVKTGNIVHNVAYSDELLESSYKDIKRVLKTIQSDIKLPDMSVYSKLIPSECRNCHYGQEEINVSVFGIEFSHNIHIEKNHLKCDKCHSNQKRHGELIITRQECLSCHHTPKENNCAKCHDAQAQIYSGTIGLTADESPDVMYDEDVECRDCHENNDQVITKADASVCVDCHDEGYKENFIEWQTEVVGLMDEIDFRLKSINVDSLDASDRARYEKVSSVLETVRKDGSRGIHNFELLSQGLKEYRDIILRIVE